MHRRNRLVLLSTLILVLALLAGAASAQGPIVQDNPDELEGIAPTVLPGDFPFQYMIKFVCGRVFPPLTPEETPPLKPGNYATAINIHNYTDANLRVGLRASLHHRRWEPPAAVPAPIATWTYRYRVLEVDCVDIWRMVGVPPETFVKGMLHLGTPQRLPVAAVYTAEAVNWFNPEPGTPPDPGAGISIDVEYLEPFLILQPPGLGQ